MPRRKITFIGSGQITVALSTLLILQNRHIFDKIDSLKEQVKAADSEGLTEESKNLLIESERLDNEIIEISILGRKGSESLEAIKERGFSINTRTADGKSRTFQIYTGEFVCITNNADEIGKQNDIFLATKTYSYDQTIIDSIKKLQIELPSSPGKETNIIFAQNGIPFWFEIFIKDRLKSPPSSKEEIDFTREFGHPSALVGCVLNFACCVNSNLENSNPDYNSYTLITPLEKIAMPMRPVEGTIDKPSFRPLLKIFPNAGIDIASRESSLVLEMLLKLQVNTALGLCTLTGKTVGEVVADEKLNRILCAISNEINQFAQHLRCPPLRDREAFLKRIEPSRDHLTSMAIDFNIGRPLEFGIYKKTFDIAERSGFTELPLTRQLYSALENLVIMRDAPNTGGSKRWTTDEVRESAHNLKAIEELVTSAAAYRPRSPVSSSLQPHQGSPSAGVRNITSRPRTLSGGLGAAGSKLPYLTSRTPDAAAHAQTAPTVSPTKASSLPLDDKQNIQTTQ